MEGVRTQFEGATSFLFVFLSRLSDKGRIRRDNVDNVYSDPCVVYWVNE